MKTKINRKKIDDFCIQSVIEHLDQPDTWQILPAECAQKYHLDYLLERVNGNCRERIAVKIKVSCEVSAYTVRKMNQAVRRMAGRYSRVVRKVVFVPLDANTSRVSGNLEVQYIPYVVCNGQEIEYFSQEVLCN